MKRVLKLMKALLAFALVAALMCTLFAACAQDTEKPDTNKPADANTETQKPADDKKDDKPAEDEKPADTEEPPVDEEPEELVEIEYIFYDFSNNGGDHGERIAAAVNEITEKELGIHVNFHFIFPGDWASKAGMMIASGETVDLMCMCPPVLSLNAMYNSNQVMDITEMLPEYAPEAYEQIKNYLGNYTIDGRVYGAPALRNYCTNGYLLLDKNVLEELGLTEKAKNMTSWSEYEEIMAAVTEKYGGQGYYANTNGIADLVDGINGMNFSDVVKNRVSGLGVILADFDGQVSLLQESESFKASRSLIADWFNKGYIYPDAIIGTVVQDDLWKQNVVFSGPQNAEYGVEVAKTASFGKEVMAVQVVPGVVSSASWGQVVPINAEEPEAALKFLNACYTNGDIVDILYRGIEGEDFNVVDGQVSYVEGAHYQQTACFFGSEFLATPLLGNGADFYEIVKGINQSAEVSPFMGFTLNTKDMDLVISQINAVMDQYKITINCGGYTEALNDEFVSKLEAAGVRDYLDEVQKQVDSYLASK